MQAELIRAFWAAMLDESKPPTTIDIASVKAKYRQTALAFHPDKPNGSNEMFVPLKDAYDKTYRGYGWRRRR